MDEVPSNFSDKRRPVQCPVRPSFDGLDGRFDTLDVAEHLPGCQSEILADLLPLDGGVLTSREQRSSSTGWTAGSADEIRSRRGLYAL
jgi:hypothetical protein